MIRAVPLLLISATLVLSGCAKQPQAIYNGTLPGGLVKGERLAVVLSAHEKCDMEPSCDAELSPSLERSFASCLTEEMDRKTVLRASTIRDSVFPGQDFAATPRTSPEWRAQLERAEFRKAIEPFNLRYVAFATVNSTRTYRKPNFVTSMVVSVFQPVWDSSTRLIVELLDVKAGRSLGNLSARKVDGGFVVIGLFLIVPVIVFPVWTRTEYLACSAIAMELEKALRSKDANR
jgi:hypothetical protein